MRIQLNYTEARLDISPTSWSRFGLCEAAGPSSNRGSGSYRGTSCDSKVPRAAVTQQHRMPRPESGLLQPRPVTA